MIYCGFTASVCKRSRHLPLQPKAQTSNGLSGKYYSAYLFFFFFFSRTKFIPLVKYSQILVQPILLLVSSPTGSSTVKSIGLLRHHLKNHLFTQSASNSRHTQSERRPRVQDNVKRLGPVSLLFFSPVVANENFEFFFFSSLDLTLCINGTKPDIFTLHTHSPCNLSHTPNTDVQPCLVTISHAERKTLRQFFFFVLFLE